MFSWISTLFKHSVYGERKKKISQITNPLSLSSIIPRVNTVVKNYIKTNNIDFKSEQYNDLKQNFITLHSIPMEQTAKGFLKNIDYYLNWVKYIHSA